MRTLRGTTGREGEVQDNSRQRLYCPERQILRPGVFVCSCFHNKNATDWVASMTFTFSQIWRLKVRDRGAGTFGFSGASLALACRWPPSHCVLTWPFPVLTHPWSSCPHFLFLQGHESDWIRAHPKISFLG